MVVSVGQACQSRGVRAFLFSRRSLRLLGRLAIVIAISALLLEGFFRYVLFGDDPFARRLGTALPSLREPQSYAHVRSREYWLLKYALDPSGRREANYDPILGWMNPHIERETYRYLEAGERGGRRPILFFGDSFASCVTAKEDCWQGLLADSDLGERFVLLNFGNGGYGLGQISLLCRLALPAYLDQDPLVVVSLLVDDDLDRAVLGFRSWPKPRFLVDAEGQAQVAGGSIPRTRQEFLDREGIGISSYALRHLLFGTPFGSRLVPGWKRSYRLDHNRSVRALTRALLADLVEHLEQTGLQFTFLLFHGESFLRDRSPYRWRDELVIEELDRLGAPMLLAREALREDLGRSGHDVKDYFIPRGRKGEGHYGALGNQVVFRVLHAWIAETSR